MAGDRIKTDRRDAEKLARSYRSGDLSPVWVPDAHHESLRDLVRAREAAKEDELRARHRLSKYLLRYGQRPGEGCFERASEVMSYTGLVPSECSSGTKSRRGAITKTCNSHLRRVLVESAWQYPELGFRLSEQTREAILKLANEA
jgi:transposase